MKNKEQIEKWSEEINFRDKFNSVSRKLVDVFSPFVSVVMWLQRNLNVKKEDIICSDTGEWGKYAIDYMGERFIVEIQLVTITIFYGCMERTFSLMTNARGSVFNDCANFIIDCLFHKSDT